MPQGRGRPKKRVVKSHAERQAQYRRKRRDEKSSGISVTRDKKSKSSDEKSQGGVTENQKRDEKSQAEEERKWAASAIQAVTIRDPLDTIPSWVPWDSPRRMQAERIAAGGAGGP